MPVQEDGNLVLYTVDRRVAWASNTDNRISDAYTLEVRSLRFMLDGRPACHYQRCLAQHHTMTCPKL